MTIHDPIASVDIMGTAARRILLSASAGSLEAVFARSLYLRLGDELVCLGGPAIGNGPLNLVLRSPLADRWIDGCAPGERVRFAQERIEFQSGRVVELAAARTWHPPPLPAWTRASLDAGLTQLRARLPVGIPCEGLGCYARETARPASLAARAAAPYVAAIGAWAASPCAQRPAPREAVAFLLGLGPGLTPSGDDLLGGCLLALHAVRHARRADRLWRAIADCGRAATNDISRAHLRMAAGGQGGEPMHRILGAILACDGTSLGAGLDCLAGLGHSSPWDTIAGFAVILRGVNELQRQEPRTT